MQTALRTAATIIAIILALAVVGLVAILVVDELRPNPAAAATSLPDAAGISYERDWNYQQGYNECGPYSFGAAVRAVRQEDFAPSEALAMVHWRGPNGMTFPWSISDALHAAGLEAAMYDAAGLSNDEKLQFLREQLSNGSPVVLLGSVGEGSYTDIVLSQHYVTMLGYDAEGNFTVYDPAMWGLRNGKTIDTNGDAPGNTTWPKDALLAFWNRGGVLGFFTGTAIVASD